MPPHRSKQTTRRWLLLAAALLVLCQGISAGHLHLEPSPDHLCATCQHKDTADSAQLQTNLPPRVFSTDTPDLKQDTVSPGIHPAPYCVRAPPSHSPA